MKNHVDYLPNSLALSLPQIIGRLFVLHCNSGVVVLTDMEGRIAVVSTGGMPTGIYLVKYENLQSKCQRLSSYAYFKTIHHRIRTLMGLL